METSPLSNVWRGDSACMSALRALPRAPPGRPPVRPARPRPRPATRQSPLCAICLTLLVPGVVSVPSGSSRGSLSVCSGPLRVHFALSWPCLSRTPPWLRHLIHDSVAFSLLTALHCLFAFSQFFISRNSLLKRWQEKGGDQLKYHKNRQFFFLKQANVRLSRFFKQLVHNLGKTMYFALFFLSKHCFLLLKKSRYSQ